MFIDCQGRRGAVLMLNTLFLAAACAGPEPGDDDPAQTAVDSSEITRLDDRIDPNALCTPFVLQAIERSADVLSAVAGSDALQDCVVREVNDPITASRGPGTVIPCSTDVDSALPLSTQGFRMVEALNDPAHLELNCNFGPGFNSAGYGTWGSEAERSIVFNGDWRRETWPAGMGGVQWTNAARTLGHAYLHQHGYSHPDQDCFMNLTPAERCSNPRCTWLRACGGSGTPTGPNLTDQVDWRNRCSVERGLPENEWDVRRVASGSWPSTMIVGLECIARQIDQSASPCGSLLNNPACGAGEARLLNGYSTSSRVFNGTCQCFAPQRRVASFRTSSGRHYLQAAGGAGSIVQAVSTEIGASESFWLNDLNGGRLMNNEYVTIKVFGNATFGGADTFWTAAAAGAQVRADSSTDDGLSGQNAFQIRRTDGDSSALPITDGVQVSLYAPAAGRFINAAGGGGAGVFAGSTAVGPWETFTYVEPARRQLVHLRFDAAANYVQYDGTTSLELTTGRNAGLDPLGPEYQSLSGGTAVVGTMERRRRSFWVVDHDGDGVLDSGDVVSFESAAQAGPGTLWNTCASGTGNVRGNALHRSLGCARFVIERVSGTGPINHNTPVRLNPVGSGRWLVAYTASGATPNRVRLDASTRSSATAFTMQFVQETRF